MEEDDVHGLRLRALGTRTCPTHLVRSALRALRRIVRYAVVGDDASIADGLEDLFDFFR
jgi:hypothetical protein